MLSPSVRTGHTSILRMMSHSSQVFLLVVAWSVSDIALVKSQRGNLHVCTEESKRESPVRFLCGAPLVNMVTKFCYPYGIHYVARREVMREKRAIPNIRGILLPKHSALSYLRKRRSQYGVGESNINCECCFNSCNTREMLQYCAADPFGPRFGGPRLGQVRRNDPFSMRTPTSRKPRRNPFQQTRRTKYTPRTRRPSLKLDRLEIRKRRLGRRHLFGK